MHLLFMKGLAIQTVTISFYKFSSVSSRLWALSQMARARLYLPKIAGLSFYKLFGAGSGQGFTMNVNPLSNSGIYAILAVWDSEKTATEALLTEKVFQRYKRHAKRNWNIFLTPTSVRGIWSGHNPFNSQIAKKTGYVVALTRATIKPNLIFKFWRKVPDIQKVIGNDQNVIFKIGLGEIPFRNQVTFSIWPDEEMMNNFARANGPHAAAIKAVRKEAWFSEELYARFEIIKQNGSWEGNKLQLIGNKE